MTESIKTYLRRLATIGAVMALLVVTAAPAGAQPPSQTGDWSGAGQSAILDVDVLESDTPLDIGTDLVAGDLLGSSLVDLVLAPSRQAAATTDGLSLPGGEAGGQIGGALGGLSGLGGILGGTGGGVLGGILPGLTGGGGGGGGTSGDLVSFGEGTNVEGNLAGIDLSDILVHALQTAPPDNENPAVDELLSIPSNGILAARAARAEAQARDISVDACPEGPASRGFSEVAEAGVLPTGDVLNGGTGGDGIVSGLPLGGLLGGTTDGLLGGSDLTAIESPLTGDALVELGPTVSSETVTQLVNISGQSTLGVQSAARADLTSLSLLGGAVDVGVSSPVILRATAAGTPGNASVQYNDPVVTINSGDTLGAGGLALPLLGGGGGGLLDPGGTLGGLIDSLLTTLGLDNLLVEIEQGELQQEVSDDGTHAAASASLLRIGLLPVLGDVTGGAVLGIDVAPQMVEANAPAGGVNCEEPEPTPTPTKPAPKKLPVTGGGALAVAGMSIMLAGSVLHRRRRRS